MGAKYKFLSGNFAKLINEGVIKLIYTSATLGEVKCHIESDVRETVEEYNRFIRKNLSKLTDVNDLKTSQINNK